ncbi:hypothetical protein AGMMS49944_21730 [Spirochaetia bacterium]|nr:hypothetical protein AGMMS49944_21730 [Spirochaetia bacterium]
MIIEQTVEIPENHRVQVFFDIPYTVPAGRQVKVALDLSVGTLQEEKAEQAPFKKGDWRRLCGTSAGSAGTDRILRDRAREALIDEARFAERHGTEIAPAAVARAAKWGITLETLKAEGIDL